MNLYKFTVYSTILCNYAPGNAVVQAGAESEAKLLFANALAHELVMQHAEGYHNDDLFGDVNAIHDYALGINLALDTCRIHNNQVILFSGGE